MCKKEKMMTEWPQDVAMCVVCWQYDWQDDFSTIEKKGTDLFSKPGTE